MLTVNGKEYPLWNQFVERKNEWIGKTLRDDGDSFDISLGYTPQTTEIVDITLEPNGKESVFFSVVGKDFTCGFDVNVGGISGNQKKTNEITFSGYGGHTWSIKKCIQK